MKKRLDVVQPINKLATFFYDRTKADGLVVLTNNPHAIYKQFPEAIKLYVIKTPLQVYRRKKGGPPLPPNSTMIRPNKITKDFLSNKIFICFDYLGTQSLVLQKQRLRFYAKNSLLSITSIKSHRWSLKILSRLVSAKSSSLVGKSERIGNSASYGQFLAVGGRLGETDETLFPLLPVLAIVPQYKEIDIIKPVIGHLLKQGLDVHVIDNWSNDGSFEVIQKLAEDSAGRVTYERFPKKNTNKYEWDKILRHVTEIASSKLHDYPWVMLCSADEIRWSPWKDVTLQQAFSFVDYMGYNCIDYTVFNFKPIKDGFKAGMDPMSFFQYGEFGTEPWSFVQINTWKNHPEAELVSSGGHSINLPNRKIFPLKFFLSHYPLRSNAQAKEKIFKNRKPRFTAKEKARGWHVHYDNIQENNTFIQSKSGLVCFSNKYFLEKYLVQRISGIGIVKK